MKKIFQPGRKNIYLDYAATTPVDPAVVKVMRPYFDKAFGNPSSLYKQGTRARAAIEASRKTIAGIIGARPSEIVFTAGGTESCNLGIFGAAKNYPPTKKFRPHIITSAIEHHAVLKPIEALKGEGYQVTILDVDSAGQINARDLKKVIRPETILISLMYANNEIGTIEPVAEVGKLLTRINTDRLRNGLTRIVFHTDACQAAGSLDLDVHRLNVDLMSINGSKVYGPKQTGFLFIRTGINLKPLVYGGGQEYDLRSGTENVPGIVGLAKALELVRKSKVLEDKRIAKLQSYFLERLMKIEGVRLNGPANGHNRLANNINIMIDGVEGEALIMYLDAKGIAVSTGSACATGLADPSHVLMSIGLSAKQAKNSIRMTLGKSTTKDELDYVLEVLKPLIAQLRMVKNFL